MSYRKHHIKNKINFIKPKVNIFKCAWFWYSILAGVVLATAVYFLVFFSGFFVSEIKISGNQKISTQALSQLVENNVLHKFVDFGWVKIYSKSIFLVNTKAISKEAVKNFPAIEKIIVKRHFFKTISVDIQERSPIGVFCNKNEDCFLVDASGVIFEAVNNIPENTFIVRQEVSDNLPMLGEQAVDKNILASIAKAEKSLKDNYGVNIVQAVISSPIRLDLTTSEGWKVYLSTEAGADINAQLSNMLLLLGGEITPAIRENLEYIDLRYKNRAYYK